MFCFKLFFVILVFFVCSSKADSVNVKLSQNISEKHLNNLILHGDFEKTNKFIFPNALEGKAQLTSSSPIADKQSLLVNFTGFSLYSPLAHRYVFPENTYLKSLQFTGLMKILSGADTESVIAEAHVTYHNDGKCPYSFARVSMTGDKNSIESFNVNLALDETRRVKHVYLKFLYTKQHQNLSILLDNIKLYTSSESINNLLAHGDFENTNEFSFPNASVGLTSLSNSWPIEGQQSLLVNFTNFYLYNPLSHQYTFPKNTYLKNVQFNGMMKMLNGADTEAVIVETHVTYHNNDQYPYIFKRIEVTGDENSIESFNVNLALDETRKVKHVYLKFLFTKQEKDLSVLLDNLQLYVKEA
jgi:hypothetical protein